MAGDQTQPSAPPLFTGVSLFNLGSETSEALVSAQKILLESYEETMRTWFERVQTEAALWSDLPVRIAGSGSVVQALAAYSDCVSRQMQMSMEDGQQLVDDCRRIARKVVNSLGGERSVNGNNLDLPSCL